MGTGVGANGGRRAEQRARGRWWVVFAVVAVVGAVAWRTASFATAMELVAVLGLLLGVGIAFGAMERRPRVGSAFVPPPSQVPDERLAARVDAVLSSFDRIEHRRLEAGSPWPQVLVGPAGAVVVEVCPVQTVVELDASGVRDRGDPLGRPCTSCQQARRLAGTVRDALAEHDLDVPVRTVSVVGDATAVHLGSDAPEDLAVVPVRDLAVLLARGPVLPMWTVDAAFQELTRAVARDRTTSA